MTLSDTQWAIIAHLALVARVTPAAPARAKFGNHLPFYSQANIHSRQCVNMDHATLCNRVGRACFHLRPVVEHMR